MEKVIVKPEKMGLKTLLEKVREGKIRIPVFQRDFVWEPQKMSDLFDSILRGYPIGSLLLWRPEEEELYEVNQEIGPYKIEERNKKGVLYVLDGYQRITTLFGVLSNPKDFKAENFNSEINKKFKYSYDLKANDENGIKFKLVKTKYNDFQIPLYRFIDTYEYLDLLDEIRKKGGGTEIKDFIEKCKNINKIFHEYEIPYIEIFGGEIESAVEIFSRVNSTGKMIDTDYMLSALSYNKDTNFLLSNRISEFLRSISNYNYANTNREVILNCIVNSKGTFFYDIKIKDLKEWKNQFEELTTRAMVHIKKAIEFAYYDLKIVSFKYLPYPTQLIFFSEFFRLNPHDDEADFIDKKGMLVKWFWKTTYLNYFSASLTFQRSAYKKFIYFSEKTYDSSINGIIDRNPEEQLEVDNRDKALPFPEKLDFSGVRSKALQLFIIKNLEVQSLNINETIKEIYIFNKKDRTPGNIILRLSSEFEGNEELKSLDSIILNSSSDVLQRYFLDDRLKQLYREGKEDEFITLREELIKEKEKAFVVSLDIAY